MAKKKTAKKAAKVDAADELKNMPMPVQPGMPEIPKEALILKRKVWEPENLFSLFGKTNREGAGFLEAKPGFWGRIKKYIRANYFIPDSRKYWIGPSVRYLREIIDKEIS